MNQSGTMLQPSEARVVRRERYDRITEMQTDKAFGRGGKSRIILGTIDNCKVSVLVFLGLVQISGRLVPI
jgi:hypothetical protein